MTEFIRFFATKINDFAGTHFCAPRRKVELPLRVALVHRNSCSRATPTFYGYTKDISATGLAILLPIAHFTEQLLNQSQRTFRVVLELTSGVIEADAAVVRYEVVEAKDGLIGTGCLIGAHIVKMRDDHRQRFIQHLHSIN